MTARYEYAQEWLDAIKLAWSSDDFDLDGRFIRLQAGARQAEALSAAAGRS